MQRFAHGLAMTLHGDECLLLSGTLGAGKTTFARALILTLCGEGTEVVSPTFLLVQHYDACLHGRNFPILHCDLYRVEQEEELWELGLEEAVGRALVIVEWPEVGAAYWPENALSVHITHDEADPHARRLQVTAQDSMVAAVQTFFADWESSQP